MGTALFIVGAVVVAGLIVGFVVWLRRSTAKRASTETAEILTIVQRHTEERDAEDRAAREELDRDARNDPPGSIV